MAGCHISNPLGCRVKTYTVGGAGKSGECNAFVATNRLPNRMLTLTGSHYVRVIEHCANIASLIWVSSEPPASTRPNVENMLDTRGFNSRRIITRETFDRPPPSINDATAIQVNFRTRCVHACNNSRLLEPLIHALKSRHRYNNSDIIIQIGLPRKQYI